MFLHSQVKSPRLCLSGVQGQMILICQYDLKTIFGYQFVLDMTTDERTDALEDAPETVVGRQAEDDYIIGKCAETAGLPARATNIMMFCNSLWADMTRTISADSDKFKVVRTHSCTKHKHVHSRIHATHLTHAYIHSCTTHTNTSGSTPRGHQNVRPKGLGLGIHLERVPKKTKEVWKR